MNHWDKIYAEIVARDHQRMKEHALKIKIRGLIWQGVMTTSLVSKCVQMAEGDSEMQNLVEIILNQIECKEE